MATEDNKEADADPGNYLHAVSLMAATGGYNDFAEITHTTNMAVSVPFGDNYVTLNTAPTNEALEESAVQMGKLSPDQQYSLYRKAIEQLYGKSLEEQAALIQARTNDPGLKSPLINVNTNWRSFTKDKVSKFQNENETDMKFEHESISQFGSSSEQLSITEYVTQQLNDAISQGVTTKAVGADEAFTTIKDPSQGGITMKLTEQGYRNAMCPISDINEDLKYFTIDAISKLHSLNIGLIEAGCYVGDIEDQYWTPDADDSAVPQTYYHSKHRSSLIDSETGKPYHCLPNRGGFENLSLVGLASVGAMGFSNNSKGNDPNIGGIQSAILSVRLLAIQDGAIKTYQIESKSFAIHNKLAQKQLATKGITLIQDDEIFSDVIVSFGTYGVITHAYLTLFDAFYLDMYRESVTFKVDNQQPWIDLYNKINNDDEVYQSEMWFQPYQDKVWRQKCTMTATYFKKTPQGYIPNTLEEITKYGGANKNIDDFPLSLVLTGAATTQAISNAIHTLRLKGVGTMAKALNLGLEQVMITPHTDPNTSQEVTTLTLSCVEALDFGTSNLVPTNTSGNSFKIENSVTAISAYIQTIQDLASNDYLTITSPLALRFSAKSFGSVSCAGEYSVGWVEQPIINVGNDSIVTRGGYKIARANSISVFDNTVKFFQSNYDGKIHWGLYFDDNAKPWFNISDENKTSFFKNFKCYNKDSKFSNDFTKESGMDDYQVQQGQC